MRRPGKLNSLRNLIRRLEVGEGTCEVEDQLESAAGRQGFGRIADFRGACLSQRRREYSSGLFALFTRKSDRFQLKVLAGEGYSDEKRLLRV